MSCREKGSRLPFNGTRNRTKGTLELIHTDVCGPLTPDSLSDNKYCVSFTDDFSNFPVTYPMKSKSEVFEKVTEYMNGCENRFKKRVKNLRCYHGGQSIKL